MQGNCFMQLLIILALLLCGSGLGTQKIIEEVKPVLETLGDDTVKEALKSVEEISSVLTAVRSFAGGDSGGNMPDFSANSCAQQPTCESTAPIAFPLKPVNSFIDKEIAYSLSQYIREN